YDAGLRFCADRTDHHAARSSFISRTDVGERDDGAVGPARGTRHALDGRVVVKLDHSELAVDVPAVVQSRDRLLPGIAALREADVCLVEARLGREDALVELASPARDARLDPPKLELLLVQRRLGTRV